MNWPKIRILFYMTSQINGDAGWGIIYFVTKVLRPMRDNRGRMSKIVRKCDKNIILNSTFIFCFLLA